MAVTKNPSGRGRKPKVEIQADFEKLQGQVEQQRQEFDPKAEETAKAREAEVREVVSEISSESIVQKIGTIGLDISKYLSDVSSRLMTGTTLLNSLREAVTVERRELERLHKIDTAKTAIRIET